MLDCSLDNLHAEWEVSHRRARSRAKAIETMVWRLVGPIYDPERFGDTYDPENHNGEFLARMLARVAFRAPRTTVRTKRVEPDMQMRAFSLEHFAERWARDVDIEETLLESATDYLFSYSGLLVTQQPSPFEIDADDPFTLPNVMRLCPGEWGWDPWARTWGKRRFTWRLYQRDRNDLLDEAKQNPSEWNIEAIQRAPGGQSLEGDERTREGYVHRDEIQIVEMYVDRKQLKDEPGPEEGYNGALFTFLVGYNDAGAKAKDWLRRPRMFYGPAGGPHRLIGCYLVPDSISPLGPMQMVEGHVRDLNAVVRAMLNSARRYKRIVGFDEANVEAALVMQEAEHDFWVPIPHMKEAGVKELEIGGVPKELYEVRSWLKQVLREASGFGDAQTGSPRGDVTATAEAVAQVAAEERAGWIEDRFRKGWAGVMRHVLQLADMDDSVVTLIPGVEIGGRTQNMLYVGGSPDEERLEELRERFPGLSIPDLSSQSADERFIDGLGRSFRDLEVDVEMFSMGRKTDAQLQRDAAETLEIANMIGQYGPQALRMPEAIQQVADLRGRPELVRLIDPAMWEQATQQMHQAGAAEIRAAQPRLSRFRPQGASKVSLVGGPARGTQMASAQAMKRGGTAPGRSAGSNAGKAARSAVATGAAR